MIAVHLRPVCRDMSRSAGGKVNKLHGIRGRKSAIDLVDQLDSTKDDASPKTGAKLKRSLTKEEEKVLDIASQGSMDATAEEIRDVLNECLESNKFINAFKGFKKATDLVEIVDVKCNHDYSNATALWKANTMELLVKSMEIQHGEREATALAAKIVATINNVFREKEGVMRTNLMRKMDFKRVPKILYKPKDPSLGLIEPEQMINPLFMRDQFIGDYVEEQPEGEELADRYATASRRIREEGEEDEEGGNEARNGGDSDLDSDFDTDEYSDDDSELDEDDEDEEERRKPAPRKR